MNYSFSEITFPSSDGIHTIHADIYVPKGTPRGVVQLAHGMVDYVGRYEALADYLTSHGYIFAGNAHLGHGKSASEDSDFGHFADGGGLLYLLKDVHSMNKYLRAEYPNLPLYLLGHSMGSFIARLYTLRHPHSIQGLIIHGTSGPNPAVYAGKLVVALGKAVHGEHYRSPFVKKMTFLGYNSKFPKSEGEHAWLTREVERVNVRDSDPYTNFTFTLSAYGDLFDMIQKCNAKSWFKKYPKELPTLIVSGDMDPVGAYGKGPRYVYKRLMLEGCNAVTLKLYEGARHELFNERGREQIFADLISWLDGEKA